MTPPASLPSRFLQTFSGRLAIPLILASTASGALYNLSDTTFSDTSTTYAPDVLLGNPAAIVNGALYQRGATNSGSGTFRDLFRFEAAENPDGQQGFNRETGGGLDESFIGGPSGYADAKITKADLVTDATGLAYVFLLDVNENDYTSVDEVKIWSSSVDTDLSDLPNGSTYDLNVTSPSIESALGIDANGGTETGSQLIYDMDSNEDNSILYDGTIASGSGSSDVVIFIPVSRFDSVADTDFIYMYMQMGVYEHPEDLINGDDASILAIETSGGSAESIAIPANPAEQFTPTTTAFVPEPGSVTLLLLAAACGIGRRKR